MTQVAKKTIIDPVEAPEEPVVNEDTPIDSVKQKCKQTSYITKYSIKTQLLRTYHDHDLLMYAYKSQDYSEALKLLRAAVDKKYLALIEGNDTVATNMIGVIEELEKYAEKLQQDLNKMVEDMEQKLLNWNDEELT